MGLIGELVGHVGGNGECDMSRGGVRHAGGVDGRRW